MDEMFDPNLWCIKFLHKFHWQGKNEESLKSKAECLFSTKTIHKTEVRAQEALPSSWHWGNNVGHWLHPWLSLLSKFLWKVSFMNYTGGLLFLPVSYGRSWTKALHVGKKVLLFLIVPFCLRQGTVVRLAAWRAGVYNTFFRRALDQIPDASQWMNYEQFHIISSFIFNSFKISIHINVLTVIHWNSSMTSVQVASTNVNLVCSQVSFIDLV